MWVKDGDSGELLNLNNVIFLEKYSGSAEVETFGIEFQTIRGELDWVFETENERDVCYMKLEHVVNPVIV